MNDMDDIYAKITKETPFNLPLVPFALHELFAIESIINGHTRYLTTLSSCPQRAKRLEILENIRRRLHPQLWTLQSGSMFQLALQSEEIAELLTAMIDFIEQVKCSFMENNERDRMINAVNCWRLRLITMRSELQA
jgi:hypothetical protein